MAGDAAAMQAWIACRISETRFLAEEARAVAFVRPRLDGVSAWSAGRRGRRRHPGAGSARASATASPPGAPSTSHGSPRSTPSASSARESGGRGRPRGWRREGADELVGRPRSRHAARPTSRRPGARPEPRRLPRCPVGEVAVRTPRAPTQARAADHRRHAPVLAVTRLRGRLVRASPASTRRSVYFVLRARGHASSATFRWWIWLPTGGHRSRRARRAPGRQVRGGGSHHLARIRHPRPRALPHQDGGRDARPRARARKNEPGPDGGTHHGQIRRFPCGRLNGATVDAYGRTAHPADPLPA